MLARSHIAIGVAGAITLSEALDIRPNPVEWLALVVGSLAPDIDQASSVIARPGSLFSRLLPRWLVRTLDGIATLTAMAIHALFGHRQVTHWVVWPLLLCAAGIYFGLGPLLFFGWGYLWHLLADLCTKGGVPLFGPLLRRPVRLFSLKTGGIEEKVLATAVWLGIGYWLWREIPPDIRQALIRHFTS